MADDLVYENVPVSVRKREGQGLYEFGVVLDGAFIVFGGRKTGGVDDDIARAKQAAADEASAAGASSQPDTTQQ